QGKVIPQRIIAVKLAQAFGDVDGHAPSWRPHMGESYISRYPGNVRIQRDNKLARYHLGPDTAVDSVLRPYHPSQIEAHPLACAPLRGTGEEESNADSSLEFPPRVKLLMAK